MHLWLKIIHLCVCVHAHVCKMQLAVFLNIKSGILPVPSNSSFSTGTLYILTKLAKVHFTFHAAWRDLWYCKAVFLVNPSSWNWKSPVHRLKKCFEARSSFCRSGSILKRWNLTMLLQKHCASCKIHLVSSCQMVSMETKNSKTALL